MSVISTLVCPFVSNKQPLSQWAIFSSTRHWDAHADMETTRRWETQTRATLTLRPTNTTAQDNTAPWSRWWRAWARGSAAAGRRRSGWTWAAGWGGAGRNLLEERSEGGGGGGEGTPGHFSHRSSFFTRRLPVWLCLSLLALAQPDVPISAP